MKKNTETIQDLEGEVWKDIQGYEGLYQISNKGRVKSIKLNFVRNSHANDRGYQIINLRKGTHSKSARIHRLVAIHFIPNPDNKEQVNHIDFNPLNNTVENLEWVTNRENSCHSVQRKKKSSKYVGVQFSKSHNKWISKIRFQGKRIQLGYFYTEQEAYEARRKFEQENGISNKYV
jgi:hypothetical protein